MVGLFGCTFHPDRTDVGELLGETSRKLSGHAAQQTDVIDVIDPPNKMQSTRFDEVVVLHVLVAQPFFSRSFIDFYAEIDLVQLHVGQMGTSENEAKVAASQVLRLVHELAQCSLHSVDCENSVVELLFN